VALIKISWNFESFCLNSPKGVSINHLLEEATTLMLAEFDLKTQFEIRASRGRGNEQRGLELLEKAKNG
jgi:hypothetical protein